MQSGPPRKIEKVFLKKEKIRKNYFATKITTDSESGYLIQQLTLKISQIYFITKTTKVTKTIKAFVVFAILEQSENFILTSRIHRSDHHESESEKIFQIGAFFDFLLISKDFKVIKTDVPTLKN